MSMRESIQQLEDFILSSENYDLYFEKSPFAFSMRVKYYFYPLDVDVACRGLTSHFLREAGYDDLYSPLSNLMHNARIIPPSEAEMHAGDDCWALLLIRFRVQPPISPEVKKLYATEYLTFICLAYDDEDGQKQYQVMVASPTTGNLFKEMQGAKLAEEQDPAYLRCFEEAMDFLGERLGFAQTEDEISEQDALHEFAQCLAIQDQASFFRDYHALQHTPEHCMQQLIEQGYASEEDTPEWHYLAYRFLLQPALHAFETDWRIDNAELSDYLSSMIGQPFKLPKKSLMPEDIAQRLEKKTDYTLLNIETEQDAYCFFICLASVKNRVLKLARRLNFDIHALIR